MFSPIKSLRVVFLSKPLINFASRHSYQYWPESKSVENVFMPEKIEDRLLPNLPYTPTVVPDEVIMPVKHIKADIDMRGPERIHNQLMYKQYGIIAIGGGALIGAHIDQIRDGINRWLNTERFFAVWRIDPPWKAVSKKSMGKRGGGGKAKVHHYETPVKAGRVLIEVGGIGEFGELQRILSNICVRLPLYAIPVSQQMLDDLREEKMRLDEQNYNPFNYRQLLRQNFDDSQRKISPREVAWGGYYY